MSAKIPNRRVGLLPVLACMLMLAGCIKSDETCNDASPLVTLVFTYDRHTGTGDLFAEQVSSVDIFVYDGQGKFVEERTVAVSRMGEGNTVGFNLANGDYTFVAWGNFDEDHFTYNRSDELSASSLTVNADADDNVEIHSATLFHGSGSATVKGRNTSVPMPMVKNTNLVRIFIYIKDAVAGRSDPETGVSVRITGSNGHYDYGNSPLDCNTLTYIPRYSRENGQVLSAEMTVLRLSSGDDTMLQILDTENSGEVYNGSLTDLIFSEIETVNTDEDLDRHDTYELTFVLERLDDGTLALTGINSGPWTEVDEEDEI